MDRSDSERLPIKSKKSENTQEVVKHFGGMQRTRRSRVSREAQLIRCAIQAFAAIGISRANHADVAALAHVSVPTVFSYFPTRESLVESVLTQVERFLAGQVTSGASLSGKSVRERLVNMIVNCAASQQTHPEYIRIFFNWGASIQDEAWPRYLAFFNQMIATFESVLLDGKRDGSVPKSLDANEAAHIIVGETNMLIMMLFAGISMERVVSFIEHYVDAAMHFKVRKSVAPSKSTVGKANHG